MDKYKNMQLFCTVVEKGNFAKAAKVLNVTPAIVGRHISAMEAELGFVLFNRTTRSMQLTPGGKAYYEGAKAILNKVVELEDSLTSAHQNNPAGLIRLSAPDAMGSFLVKAIKTFRERNPDIRFDLLLSNKQVDLVKEEIDVALRFSYNLQDSSFIATRLGSTDFGLYASKDYLEQAGTPKHYSELKNHDCLHMGQSRDGDNWILHVDGKMITYRQSWAMVISDTHSLIESILAGMGIALVPSIFVQKHLSQGRISEVKGIAEFPKINIYAMYPTKKHVPYRLALFLDYLKQHFAAIIES